MYSVAFKILKNHASAEDVVSSSFEKLILNMEKVGEIPCNKMRAFIVIIVRNTAFDMLRKSKNITTGVEDDVEKIVDTEPNPVDTVISTENFEHIVSVIDGLSPALRDVAILSIYHGLTNAEIAKLLKIDVIAVRTRLSRAKKILKEQLKGE